jgi:hypothetical protein
METHLDWDQLVDALRGELQEKGDLLRLLNQQTETLYRRDPVENERLEEQMSAQLRLISRCTKHREAVFQQIASRFQLDDHASANDVILRFPDYVHPLLEALVTEVDRLSNRVDERLKQNQDLKERFFSQAPAV